MMRSGLGRRTSHLPEYKPKETVETKKESKKSENVMFAKPPESRFYLLLYQFHSSVGQPPLGDKISHHFSLFLVSLRERSAINH